MSKPLPRLILTGPESTGKSTLAHALARRLDAVLVEEYLRHYFVRIDAEGKKLSLGDALPIARGQWQWEEEAAQLAQNKPLICDTDLVSSVIYNRHYYGDQRGSELWQDWQNWAEMHLERVQQPPYVPRLYLLCDIDWPWIDDGQRDAPHLRGMFLERFRSLLGKQRLPFLILSGTLEQRTDIVLSHLGLGASGAS